MAVQRGRRGTKVQSVLAGSSEPEQVHHLAQKELARRWGYSTRTLERWRVAGHGPKFLKLNGRVRYRLEDVEAFEAERIHESTTQAADAERRRRCRAGN